MIPATTHRHAIQRATRAYRSREVNAMTVASSELGLLSCVGTRLLYRAAATQVFVDFVRVRFSQFCPRIRRSPGALGYSRLALRPARARYAVGTRYSVISVERLSPPTTARAS